MTNTNQLQTLIKRSGYKYNFISASVGITYQCLLNKIKNVSEFKATEIGALSDLLGLSASQRDEIFFSQ
jgi:hypothetical protein